MSGSRDDIEFLVSSDHRVAVLDELARGPRDREELRSTTGASSPTIGRVLGDFEVRHWIERDGRTYRLTELGTLVTEEFGQFREAMARQRGLREAWPWLPHEVDGFSIELFGDVVVSRPGPGYPYTPVERFTECLETSRTMRGFGMAVLKSGNLEPFLGQLRDGLECEYIYPSSVFAELLEWNEAAVLEAVERSNYTVMLHDDLPVAERCGICLFDDVVSICCYDPADGTLQSVVDTASAEMRSWAESYYERYRAEAQPLEGVSDPQALREHALR